MQPIKSFGHLVGVFGRERVQRAAKIADSVTIIGYGIETYEATCQGEHVVYDGAVLPGACSCTCHTEFFGPYCDHIAAVAIFVLGKGSVPKSVTEYAELHEISTAEIIDTLPAEDLREVLNYKLCSKKRLSNILRQRMRIYSQSQDPANRLNKDLYAPVTLALTKVHYGANTPKEYYKRVNDFLESVTPYLEAGYGPNMAPYLMSAVESCQDEIHRHEPRYVKSKPWSWSPPYSPPENSIVTRMYMLCDKIVNTLCDCHSSDYDEILPWLEKVIARERPVEEVIPYKSIMQLLDTDHLTVLLQWLLEQDGSNVKTWYRTVVVAERVKDHEVYHSYMLNHPWQMHNVVVPYLLERPCTLESISAIKKMLSHDVFSSNSLDRQRTKISPIIEWLRSSDLPEASALIPVLARSGFDPSEPWESIEALADTQELDDGLCQWMRSEAEEHLPASEIILFEAVLKCYLDPSSQNNAHLSIDDAKELDPDRSWEAFDKFQHLSPATAINCGIASIIRTYQDRPYSLPNYYLPRFYKLYNVCLLNCYEDQFRGFLDAFWSLVPERSIMERNLITAWYKYLSRTSGANDENLKVATFTWR